MELRPIRSKREHHTALKEAEALWNAPEGSPAADRLEVLTLLIEAYEREPFSILAPDPIDFLQHVMEAREVVGAVQRERDHDQRQGHAQRPRGAPPPRSPTRRSAGRW